MAIEQFLNELQEAWGFTSEQLADIKEKIIDYALDAMMDTAVAREAYDHLEQRIDQGDL